MRKGGYMLFAPGQAVRCVDAKMKGIGDCLTRGRIYYIREFIFERNSKALPDNDACRWDKEGGRVEVEEEPGCHFYGRRFELVPKNEF